MINSMIEEIFHRLNAHFPQKAGAMRLENTVFSLDSDVVYEGEKRSIHTS